MIHNLKAFTFTFFAAGVGESETSGGDEWSSGDETDSSTTVSSTHQDPHCDCCYCHMLHHKQVQKLD